MQTKKLTKPPVKAYPVKQPQKKKKKKKKKKGEEKLGHVTMQTKLYILISTAISDLKAFTEMPLSCDKISWTFYSMRHHSMCAKFNKMFTDDLHQQ